MDLSKLPKLSGGENPPPISVALEQTPADLGPSRSDEGARGLRAMDGYAIGAEVWIGLIIGLLLIGMSRNFPAYLFDRMIGREFHTGIIFTSDGTEVPYPRVEGFAMLTDAAIFVFGSALLCDALLRLVCLMVGRTTRRIALMFALCLTLAATLLNAFVAVKLLGINVMPLLSGMAVAFGGYVAFEQLRLLRSMRQTR